MSTNPETRTKLDDREDGFRLDRREVIQKSLAATAVAAGAFSPSIKALAQPTASVSPACVRFPGLDIKRRPVTWAIGGNLFTWNIPKAPASSYTGAFTLEVEGALLHSGTIAVTSDEPARSTSLLHELVEGSESLVIRATTSIIDAEDEGRFSRTVGTLNELPFSFDYDLLSQQVMNTLEDPAAAEIVSGFDLQPYSDYSNLILSSLPPMNAAIHQQNLLACGANRPVDAWGFWSGLASCAGTGGLTGCCIAGGLPCCIGAVGMAPTYIKCLEDTAAA